ncbi:MAG: uracil phosphoribosyltransferase [Planctomycetota bacterium]|nr:uracil phosphoribosyltransferase [Planctomycetota bacterium]MDA1106362.1 uracil phosphoribosyltransferase [Planctomycetota bacterium]
MSREYLHVSSHALVAEAVARLRDQSTPPGEFRRLVRLVGSILAVEALRELPQRQATVRTPLEEAPTLRLVSPPVLVPILRAGLPMCDGALDVVPEAMVGHLGIRRDESTARPVGYYMRLPPITPQTVALIVDPMLATGGSAASAATQLRDAGCQHVRMMCLVAAPEGVDRLHRSHPEITIWAGALDRELDERHYIRPGLGDAGDRAYGTMG